MKKIPLFGKRGQDKYAIVDDEDDLHVKYHKWWITPQGYVVGYVNKKNIPLHRFIMNDPKGMVIDHKNHNPLDNRKENLRVCTKSENAANKKKVKSKEGRETSSKYRGVHRIFRSSGEMKWVAQIESGVKGYYAQEVFDFEDEAATAYDMWALELFGEFANLNFPEKLEDYKKKLDGAEK